MYLHGKDKLVNVAVTEGAGRRVRVIGVRPFDGEDFTTRAAAGDDAHSDLLADLEDLAKLFEATREAKVLGGQVSFLARGHGDPIADRHDAADLRLDGARVTLIEELVGG